MTHDSRSPVLFFAFPPLFPYGSRNTVHRLMAKYRIYCCVGLLYPRLALEKAFPLVRLISWLMSWLMFRK